MAVLIAYVPYWWFGSSDARRVAALRTQLAGIQRQSQVVAEANARLRAEIDALETDPGAVEDVARETLGMVRNGELVIRLEETSHPGVARRERTP